MGIFRVDGISVNSPGAAYTLPTSPNPAGFTQSLQAAQGGSPAYQASLQQAQLSVAAAYNAMQSATGNAQSTASANYTAALTALINLELGHQLGPGSHTVDQWTAAAKTVETQTKATGSAAQFIDSIAKVNGYLDQIQHNPGPLNLTGAEKALAKADPVALALLKANGVTLTADGQVTYKAGGAPVPISKDMAQLAQTNPSLFAVLLLGHVNFAILNYPLPGVQNWLQITVYGKDITLPPDQANNLAQQYTQSGASASALAASLLPYLNIGSNPSLQLSLIASDNARTQYGLAQWKALTGGPNSNPQATIAFLGTQLSGFYSASVRQAFWNSTGKSYFTVAYFDSQFASLMQKPNQDDPNYYRDMQSTETNADKIGTYMQGILKDAPPEIADVLLNAVKADFGSQWYQSNAIDMSGAAPRFTEFYKALSLAIELDPSRAGELAAWLTDRNGPQFGILTEMWNPQLSNFQGVSDTITQGYGLRLSTALEAAMEKNPAPNVQNMAFSFNLRYQQSAGKANTVAHQQYTAFNLDPGKALTPFFDNFLNDPNIGHPVPVSSLSNTALGDIIGKTQSLTPTDPAAAASLDYSKNWYAPNPANPASVQNWNIIQVNIQRIRGQSSAGSTLTALPFVYTADIMGVTSSGLFEIQTPGRRDTGRGYANVTNTTIIDGTAATYAVQQNGGQAVSAGDGSIPWKFSSLGDFQQNAGYASGEIYLPTNMPVSGIGHVSYQKLEVGSPGFNPMDIVVGIGTALATIASFTPLAPVAAPLAMAGGAYFAVRGGEELVSLHDHGVSLTSPQAYQLWFQTALSLLPIGGGALKTAGLLADDIPAAAAFRAGFGAVNTSGGTFNIGSRTLLSWEATPYAADAQTLMADGGGLYTAAKVLDTTAMIGGTAQLSLSAPGAWQALFGGNGQGGWQRTNDLLSFFSGVFATGMGARGLMGPHAGQEQGVANGGRDQGAGPLIVPVRDPASGNVVAATIDLPAGGAPGQTLVVGSGHAYRAPFEGEVFLDIDANAQPDIHADIRQSGLPDNSFSHIYFDGVQLYLFIERPPLALREAYRLLEPGSTLLIRTGGFAVRNTFVRTAIIRHMQDAGFVNTGAFEYWDPATDNGAWRFSATKPAGGTGEIGLYAQPPRTYTDLPIMPVTLDAGGSGAPEPQTGRSGALRGNAGPFLFHVDIREPLRIRTDGGFNPGQIHYSALERALLTYFVGDLGDRFVGASGTVAGAKTFRAEEAGAALYDPGHAWIYIVNPRNSRIDTVRYLQSAGVPLEPTGAAIGQTAISGSIPWSEIYGWRPVDAQGNFIGRFIRNPDYSGGATSNPGSPPQSDFGTSEIGWQAQPPQQHQQGPLTPSAGGTVPEPEIHIYAPGAFGDSSGMALDGTRPHVLNVFPENLESFTNSVPGVPFSGQFTQVRFMFQWDTSGGAPAGEYLANSDLALKALDAAHAYLQPGTGNAHWNWGALHENDLDRLKVRFAETGYTGISAEPVLDSATAEITGFVVTGYEPDWSVYQAGGPRTNTNHIFGSDMVSPAEVTAQEMLPSGEPVAGWPQHTTTLSVFAGDGVAFLNHIPAPSEARYDWVIMTASRFDDPLTGLMTGRALDYLKPGGRIRVISRDSSPVNLMTDLGPLYPDLPTIRYNRDDGTGQILSKQAEAGTDPQPRRAYSHNDDFGFIYSSSDLSPEELDRVIAFDMRPNTPRAVWPVYPAVLRLGVDNLAVVGDFLDNDPHTPQYDGVRIVADSNLGSEQSVTSSAGLDFNRLASVFLQAKAYLWDHGLLRYETAAASASPDEIQRAFRLAGFEVPGQYSDPNSPARLIFEAGIAPGQWPDSPAGGGLPL
jgi:hypothetical protein